MKIVVLKVTNGFSQVENASPTLTTRAASKSHKRIFRKFIIYYYIFILQIFFWTL
jgi:hypothetical protein